MHIQYGGRYQHVLTYSGHNNALRMACLPTSEDLSMDSLDPLLSIP